MPDQTETNEMLMLAYASGDTAAFERLYKRHKAPLYRYFSRQLNSVELAQDLYQECWGRMIKSAPDYLPSAKWTTWAYRIAHNLCVDHFRTVKQVHTYDEAEHGPDLKARAQPEGAHEIDRLSERLKLCMQSLPTVQREVFLLSQETDMTLKMVSDVVNASYESVKTRLRYAKRKLQECLKHYAENEGAS